MDVGVGAAAAIVAAVDVVVVAVAVDVVYAGHVVDAVGVFVALVVALVSTDDQLD